MMRVGPAGQGAVRGLRGQTVQSCWLKAARLGPELPPMPGKWGRENRTRCTRWGPIGLVSAGSTESPGDPPHLSSQRLSEVQAQVLEPWTGHWGSEAQPEPVGGWGLPGLFRVGISGS